MLGLDLVLAVHSVRAARVLTPRGVIRRCCAQSQLSHLKADTQQTVQRTLMRSKQAVGQALGEPPPPFPPTLFPSSPQPSPLFYLNYSDTNW